MPATRAADAAVVAELAKQAVTQATKPQPNQTLVRSSAAGLEQAAQNLATALPTVLPIAAEITAALQRIAAD